MLKHCMYETGNELVTNCNQLKLVIADGKRYLTYCLPQDKLHFHLFKNLCERCA